jgi:hypothetical protein
MPSTTYKVFRDAILAQQQVTCIYQGHRRELCPVIIGHDKDGVEALLAWQFGGKTSSGRLTSEGAWKCLKLTSVQNPVARHGPWHEGRSHQSTQSCVAVVDLDINIHVSGNRYR